MSPIEVKRIIVPITLTVSVPVATSCEVNGRQTDNFIMGIPVVDVAGCSNLDDIAKQILGDKNVIDIVNILTETGMKIQLSKEEIKFAITPCAGIVPETVF